MSTRRGDSDRSERPLNGWWHLYDFTPAYRYVGRTAHVVVTGPFGEKSLCGRIWNLDRRSGDGYKRCAECTRRVIRQGLAHA